MVMDTQIEESPVDTQYFKPWQWMRWFRDSKWAEMDSWDTSLREKKKEQF